MPATRIIPRSENRPQVIYVDPGEVASVCDRVQQALHPLDARPAAALYVPALGIYGSNQVDWTGLTLPPEHEVLREFDLQPQSIIVPDPQLITDREARLRAGATIRHEVTHFLGAGEIVAFRAADEYLVRAKLPPRFRSDDERWKLIAQHYAADELLLSAISCPEVWIDHNAKLTGDVKTLFRDRFPRGSASPSPEKQFDSFWTTLWSSLRKLPQLLLENGFFAAAPVKRDCNYSA